MGEVYRFNLDEGRFSMPYSFASALEKQRANDDMLNSARTMQVGGGCISVSPTHSLTAIGAEDGTVRFWDNRSAPRSSPSSSSSSSSSGPTLHLTPFLNLDVSSAVSGRGFFDQMIHSSSPSHFPGEVTSLCFDDSGMRMCAGTRGGNVALYDMRSSRPLFVKEHQYGLPIHTVQFHSGSDTVLSVSRRVFSSYTSHMFVYTW